MLANKNMKRTGNKKIYFVNVNRPPIIAMNFLDLPTEILQHVASFLSAESLSSLSQTCRLLNEIARIDSLWQALAKQDYQVRSAKGWNISYRDIYTKVTSPTLALMMGHPNLCPSFYQSVFLAHNSQMKSRQEKDSGNFSVLHKLCGILGLKRLALVPYGGLVNVCWADGEIQVNRYLTKPEDEASSDLSCQQLFSLRWDAACEVIKVFCVQCPSGPQPAIHLQNGKYHLLKCADKDCRVTHMLKELCHGQTDQRFQCGFDDHPDAFSKFSLHKGFNCPMLPVLTPTEADQARSPIKLGIYKGDYGSHGVEILHFTINQSDHFLLEGLKIVGDPNVPAGQVSVTVFLDKPIVLSEEDQASISDILRAGEERDEDFSRFLNDNNNAELLQQPFLIPADCYDRTQDAPNICLARYLGIGKIAGTLYDQPSHCKCHFIKFSDVKFGVMWLELSSFSLFYKVKDI